VWFGAFVAWCPRGDLNSRAATCIEVHPGTDSCSTGGPLGVVGAPEQHPESPEYVGGGITGGITSARAANTVTTSSGRVRAVCEFCGRQSRPVALVGGRLSILDLPLGWSSAPYPDTFTHPDGSTGSLWQCPACCQRLRRGESMRARCESRSGRMPS